MDYLFALLTPQKIKSYYDEFSFPTKLSSAIMVHIPRIKRENPDLARKIDDLFKANLEEILSGGMKRFLE